SPGTLPRRVAGRPPARRVARPGRPAGVRYQMSSARVTPAAPAVGERYSGAGADAEHGVRERAFWGVPDRNELRNGLVHPAAQPLRQRILRAAQDLAEFVQRAVQVTGG